MKKSKEERSTQRPISRRDFLASTALLTATAWISVNIPRPLTARAVEESTERAVLSEEGWRTIEAMTAHIIPTDDTPGALEAGCVNFIDKALANEDSKAAPLYEAGIAALDAVSMKAFQAPYAKAEKTHQLALLSMLEDGKVVGWPDDVLPQRQFFETVRLHTIIGFLADPSYGGNKDFTGWKVIGYPGPAHHRQGYSAEQMVGKAAVKPVWEK